MKYLLIGLYLTIECGLRAQQSDTLPSLPIGAITVHVLDEQGSPVPKAKVTLAFQEPRPKWGSSLEIPALGITDIDGNFSGSGPCPMEIGGNVQLTGYYLSYLPKFQFTDIDAGKCKPWNPTIKVLLKKIIKPTAMYAKKVRAVVPAFDRPVGFDLQVGEWVKPFGKGKTEDLLFTLSRTTENSSNVKINALLAFTNKGDGVGVIQESADQGTSQLKLPRNAPTEGYEANWTSVSNHESANSPLTQAKGIGYYLRIRSVIQNDQIQTAQYGKIEGDIKVTGAAFDHPVISFTYCLNPDGTTNLEFDPANNLLKNLKFLEQVLDP